MVTTRFFTFFLDLFGEKPKWTFINVQNRVATNKSRIIYFFIILEITFANAYIFLSIYTVFAIFLIIFDSFSGIVPPNPPIACRVKLR